jgi:hypothetical protein
MTSKVDIKVQDHETRTPITAGNTSSGVLPPLTTPNLQSSASSFTINHQPILNPHGINFRHIITRAAIIDCAIIIGLFRTQ